MDFEYIVLTRKELRRLHALAKAPHGLDSSHDEARLMNNKLISRTRYGSQDGSSNIPLSIVSSIEERGKQYLIYRKNKRRQWWWNNGLQIVNLLLALIAAVTGIIALIKQ